MENKPYVKNCKITFTESDERVILQNIKEKTRNAPSFWFKKKEEDGIIKATSLEEILYLFGWFPIRNFYGSVLRFEFVGDHLGKEFQLFSLFTDCMENDSFVEIKINPEEDCKRYIFRNGKVIRA